MNTYGLHGKVVRSNLRLARRPVGSDSGPVDFEVTLEGRQAMALGEPVGRCLARFPASARVRRFYSLVETSTGYLLRLHGILDALIDRDLRQVRCLADPSVPTGYVEAYTANTVLSTLLILGGDTVLHASAVAVPACDGGSEAIAITGDSASGKSTLAALLCATGALAVTDDVMRLAVDGKRVAVNGGLADIRLRSSAASILSLFAGVEHWTTVDGRIAMALPSAGLGPFPLRGVVMPRRDSDCAELTVEPMSPPDALLALARMGRVDGWLDERVMIAQFDAVADIASSVPVLVAHLPPADAFTMEDAIALRRAITEALS